MKRIILGIVLLISMIANAQTFHVTGYVFEDGSSEPIINAVVYEPGTGNYTFTNNYGFFSLSLKPGKHTIMASLVGYKSVKKELNLEQDTSITFYLQSTTVLRPVQVTASRNNILSPGGSDVTISSEEISLLPTLGANSDVIKAYQLMPGVVVGREGSSDMVVRGSGPDENLVLLDGVPLYYVNHLGGFLSTFNTDAINNATLYKGDFPARYGGRLASVLDVSMRNGNMKRRSGALTTGVLVSRLTLEYPIVKNRSSLLVSARTAPIGYLLRPITQIGLQDMYFYYSFYDVNAKWNYIINRKNRIYLSFYRGDDPLIYGYVPRDDPEKSKGTQRWGNTLISFRWNHVFAKSAFSNLTAYYTLFRYKFSGSSINNKTNDYYYYSESSQVQDFALNYDINFQLLDKLYLRTGTQNVYHSFNPFGERMIINIPSDNYKLDTSLAELTIPTLENSLYSEAVYNGRRVGGNIGFRLTSYFLTQSNKLYFSPEPRILVRFSPIKNLAIKASFARTTQFLHRAYITSESDLPLQMWFPSTQDILPSHSQQWSLGLYASSHSVNMSVVGFYKKESDLYTFAQGISPYNLVVNDKNVYIKHGIGWAYGAEVFIRKTQGKTTGWISYTYSRSLRQFDGINNGEPYPYRFDRPHSFIIVLMHRFTHGFVLSADWVYGTGFPYTRPVGTIPVVSNQPDISYYPDFVWEPRNSSRMEDYHRLDIALKFIKHRKGRTRIWTISVYNVYNHMNPYTYVFDYKQDYWGAGAPGYWYQAKFTLFPFLPSISYTIKW